MLFLETLGILFCNCFRQENKTGSYQDSPIALWKQQSLTLEQAETYTISKHKFGKKGKQNKLHHRQGGGWLSR